MAMPKLGPSLTAAAPPVAKFGVKFLDKALKLQKPWRRIQDYIPLVTGAIGFAIIYQGKYIPYGEALWYSSEGMFLDQVFTSFYQLIGQGGGGGGQSMTLQLAGGKKLALRQNMTAQQVAQQLGIATGAQVGTIAEI